MPSNAPSTHQKALSINLDDKIYGAIAEIGAAQEVARWFFRVGAAAGSVAKTISAYDMQVSDEIYGKASRYVARDRVEAMLQCPSSNKWNRRSVLLKESFVPHHRVTRRVADSANDVSRWSFV